MPSTLHEQLNLLIKGGDPNIPQLPLIAGALGKLADDQGGLPSTVARIASALDKQGDLRQPIPRIVDALEKLADHEAGLPATVKRIASALEKLAERDSLLQPPPAYDDGGRGADERWEDTLRMLLALNVLERMLLDRKFVSDQDNDALFACSPEVTESPSLERLAKDASRLANDLIGLYERFPRMSDREMVVLRVRRLTILQRVRNYVVRNYLTGRLAP